MPTTATVLINVVDCEALVSATFPQNVFWKIIAQWKKFTLASHLELCYPIGAFPQVLLQTILVIMVDRRIYPSGAFTEQFVGIGTTVGMHCSLQ